MHFGSIKKNRPLVLPHRVHHGSDEKGQVGLAVDEHVDKGPVQNDGFQRPVRSGVPRHSRGRPGPGALFIHSDESLVQHAADEDVALGGSPQAGKVRRV